jgi:hypothetical protein
MNRKAILSLFAFIVVSLSRAQKPPIDTSTFGKWPQVTTAKLSDDGKYALYWINNQPWKSNTLVVKAIMGNWQVSIPDAVNAEFVAGGNRVVFEKKGDSLGMLSAGDAIPTLLAGVQDYKVTENGRWLAYRDTANELTIKDLHLDKEYAVKGVAAFYFNESKPAIILQERGLGESGDQILLWMDFRNHSSDTVWSGTAVSDLTFSRQGDKLSFIENTSTGARRLCVYTRSVRQMHILTSNPQQIEGHPAELDRISGFSRDAERVFFYVRLVDTVTRVNSDQVSLDIWNYKDLKLQSAQLVAIENPALTFKKTDYLMMTDLAGHRIVEIEHLGESLISGAPPDADQDRYALVQAESKVDRRERNWNPASSMPVYLVSLVDGSKMQVDSLSSPAEQGTNYVLSPDGAYLVWYSFKAKDYFSYSIKDHLCHDVSEAILTSRVPYEIDLPDSAEHPYPYAGWVENSAFILLYDQYDIWKVDVTAKTLPLCLTKGLAGERNMVFRLGDPQSNNYREKDTVLLVAFDRDTKRQGFCRVNLGRLPHMDSLTMQPFLFGEYANSDVINHPPIKARHSNVYLVRRMEASESPNFFTTKDFRTFLPLSDVYPERQYNWLTSELVTWGRTNGRKFHGLLYQPENLDKSKQYPLIVYVYERFSDGLHGYIKPEACSGDINIPWFVSNGYLVFLPDIWYKIGQPGQSALDAVVSGLGSLLSQYPWINRSKLGLQGISWGGYETDFIITHSKLFAAALSASGVSDMISHYGDLFRGGVSNQGGHELGQDRIGNTLWAGKTFYIENSPIFFADRVTTPLLMMNNKKDQVVHFSQGIEFFTALRRLGKKAWLLQYDNGAHGLWPNTREAMDYSIRVMQFFNYYLRDDMPPKWMTEGVRASMKGIESGLEIDSSGRVP